MKNINKFNVLIAVPAAFLVFPMPRTLIAIAVGYPRRDETVSLDASVWNCRASSFAPYRVVWGKNGRIREVATDPATHARMVYRKQQYIIN